MAVAVLQINTVDDEYEPPNPQGRTVLVWKSDIRSFGLRYLYYKD